jgi:hypothetical protein
MQSGELKACIIPVAAIEQHLAMEQNQERGVVSNAA